MASCFRVVPSIIGLIFGGLISILHGSDCVGETHILKRVSCTTVREPGRNLGDPPNLA